MHFDELLVRGAGWALGLGTLWAGLVAIAAAAEVVSEGRVALTARLRCPESARRALLAGFSVVLAGGGALAAGPVAATPAPLEQGRTGQGLTLPVPTRPTGTGHAVPAQRVEVHPGDSLWRISQQRVPRASAPDVARIVERTYRANRRVIGPDPDLIQPGQRLVLPEQRRHPQAPPTADR